jgi:nitrogen regulatory protein P-II 1
VQKLARSKGVNVDAKHTYFVRVSALDLFIMKLIIAIVRPFTIEKIVNELESIENFPGISVSDAEGFGQRLRTSSYDNLNPFAVKKRVEIACNDEMVEDIVNALKKAAHTGKKGDGIIFVVPIEKGILI